MERLEVRQEMSSDVLSLRKTISRGLDGRRGKSPWRNEDGEIQDLPGSAKLRRYTTLSDSASTPAHDVATLFMHRDLLKSFCCRGRRQA